MRVTVEVERTDGTAVLGATPCRSTSEAEDAARAAAGRFWAEAGSTETLVCHMSTPHHNTRYLLDLRPELHSPTRHHKQCNGWYASLGHYRSCYPGAENPDRQGIRWSEQEDADLLRAHSLGATCADIAAHHKLTVSAIVARLVLLEQTGVALLQS